MQNTIIFDNKINFKQEVALTFFLNENLDFKADNKIFSRSFSSFGRSEAMI